MYTVYKHTTPSGKIYIGITSNDPKYRWKNGYGYMNNKYFFNAIKKYGWNNISHEILFTGLSEEEAYSKEINLIKEYKSNDLKFGYNLSSGGEKSGAGVKWSEETRKNHMKSIEESKRKHTQEEKEKIRASLLKYYDKKGRKNSTNKPIKKYRTNNHVRDDKRRKKIVCVETGMEFYGAQEASDWANIKNKKLIYAAINNFGRHRTAGGYHWKYATKNRSGVD